MKQSILALAVLTALSQLVYSGAPYSGKDMKQVAPPPCPEWYGDNEWNINLWGTYAFTGTEYAPNLDLVDLIQSTTEGQTVLGTFDKYLGGDHAWGGGIDIKYFFHRYFGVGIQGYILDAQKGGFDIDLRPTDEVFFHKKTTDRRGVGSVLGTFTLRYPVPCSRFAPCAWAGVGAIFGGGQSDTVITHEIPEVDGSQQPQGQGMVPFVNAHSRHYDGSTELIGQFGVGLEYRVMRHIGWTNGFSWNVIDGPKNDFGMIQTGLNFAF